MKIKIGQKNLRAISDQEIKAQQILDEKYKKLKAKTDQIILEYKKEKFSDETRIWAKHELLKHEIKQNLNYLKNGR